MDLDKVGKFIAENRKRQNLTQKDLGELLGINPKTISKWERGVNAPDIALLTEIAKYLNVTVEELLAGEKIKRGKLSIKRFINKSNKTSKIVTITFIILTIFIIIGVIVYKPITNNKKHEIYTISTSNKDYLVNGYLILNDNDYSIDITEIKSLEKSIGRSVDIKFNILDINFVSNGNVIYDYYMKEDGELYLFEELKKLNINFKGKRENVKSINSATNEIGIEYCTLDKECSTINLKLSIKKVE